MDDEYLREEEEIAEERALEGARFGAGMAKRLIRSLTTLKPLVSVGPAASVREAAKVMDDGGVGCVLVVEAERLVGIFTERDVLGKVVAGGRDPETTTVRDVMTPDPECLTLDDAVGYALNLMSDHGFRRIPLIDAAGRPTGVVTMRNIVVNLVELIPSDVRNLPPRPTLQNTREREGA